jgi:hypothetical protein
MTTSKVTEGIVISIGLIALSLGLTWAGRSDLIDAELPLRITMAFSGLLIAYYGNSIPKVLLRSERAIMSRRFIGWAFVLAGMTTAAVWLVMPSDEAVGATFLLLGGTVLLVSLICLMSRKPAA